MELHFTGVSFHFANPTEGKLGGRDSSWKTKGLQPGWELEIELWKVFHRKLVDLWPEPELPVKGWNRIESECAPLPERFHHSKIPFSTSLGKRWVFASIFLSA